MSTARCVAGGAVAWRRSQLDAPQVRRSRAGLLIGGQIVRPRLDPNGTAHRFSVIVGGDRAGPRSRASGSSGRKGLRDAAPAAVRMPPRRRAARRQATALRMPSRLGHGLILPGMLFVGELDGGPARDGMVCFDESSIDSYLSVTGMAWWPNLLPDLLPDRPKPTLTKAHQGAPRIREARLRGNATGRHRATRRSEAHSPKVAGSNPPPPLESPDQGRCASNGSAAVRATCQTLLKRRPA